jgi:hypothetical protein
VRKEVDFWTRAVAELLLVQRLKVKVECETDVDAGYILVGTQFDENNGGRTDTAVPMEAVELTVIGKSGRWGIFVGTGVMYEALMVEEFVWV